MTTEDKLLINKCAITNRRISLLVEQYKSMEGSCPAIAAQLSKTENRSKEYENGSFIVLVVGPVKSGKSTLVNLIANAYVSPTHFLECTVRPSIISQRREGEECKITVFTSEDASNHTEQIDAIIDCIRGIEKEGELVGITKSEHALTPENIKNKVELNLDDSLTSSTLVTSITTPGGKLMKKDVFIIDMPGFDGEHANIDNPVYDTIAQRADLIIFVQSSNSAISKVSWQFLKMLSDNNKDVPVCLIHNVFDSSWWRSEEERAAAVAIQKGIAIKEIRKQGFHIDEDQCFCINLGKVEDGRKQAYLETPALQREVEEYEKLEDILYDRVINCRDAMRLSVCLGRTRQQIDKCMAAIDDELAHRAQLTERYQSVVNEFAKTEASSGDLSEHQLMKADFASLKQIIRNEAKSRIMLVETDNNHKSNSEARRIVMNFVEDCEKSITASFDRSLSLSHIEEGLFLECKKRIGDIKETAIRCHSQPLPITVNRQPVNDIPDISLSPGIDFELLIPRKPMFPLLFARFGGHSAEDVVGYINKAAERLAGSQPGDAQNLEGYLEKEGGALRPLLDQVNQLMEEVSQTYATLCKEYWQQSRDTILGSIIADKEAFDAESGQLEKLKQELIKTRDQI
ncbi:MAG: dynamin family protein [Prevotella sp.]|nr:dynamin family protein [Prevotella sp.]